MAAHKIKVMLIEIASKFDTIISSDSFATNYVKMKESRINFTVTLDQDNVPEKIMWDASDKEPQGVEETKSISLTLWDEKQKNTLRIDLWTKDMPVDDMKRFYIDCLGGMAQNILNATGDEFIAQETNTLAEKLVKHVKKTS